MARARSVSSQSVVPIDAGWTVRVTPPGSVVDPIALAMYAAPQMPANVPGTLAAAVVSSGSKCLGADSPDDFDVWYECEFDAAAICFEPMNHAFLRFDGLATIADVWLNGQHLLRSENMFLMQEVDAASALRPRSNEICIRFSSLNQFLAQRRPRPRWRTHLIDDAQLRWARTTLLGRMPGWHHHAQRIHAVGPWKPISLVVDRVVCLGSSDFRVSVDDRGDGRVEASLSGALLADARILGARLFVGDESSPLQVRDIGDQTFALSGDLVLPAVALWWPHTHGDQPLYNVRVAITLDGAQMDPVMIEFGATGFRSVELDTSNDGFALSVNRLRIFLRGACWTALDPLNLCAQRATYERSLDLAATAGMNMMRVPGFTFYETDAFYDACAEKGITLWQDFAFALIDYPSDDGSFVESVSLEAHQFLDRIELNPAIALLCGNSECAATAAMNGLSAADWSNPLFDELLPEISRELRPDVPFAATSEWGGALPFHVDAGVANYYGIGAYLRPLDDARRSGVRFASECLAFANIPERETIDRFLANREWPGNHPSWKAAVPRNVSLGWDFDDVRDHYARMLLGEDPATLRFSDSERYLALGRVASGEAMSAAFAEWRRSRSPCDGALILFFQDLWPGAGWGIFDSFGSPKSVYYYLKRVLAPIAIFFSDEGLSGLRVHVVNETSRRLDANLRVALYRNGRVPVSSGTTAVHVDARSACDVSVDGTFGAFLDSAYAYKFGPAHQDVTVAALESIEDGALLASKAFYFPSGRKLDRLEEIGLRARSLRRGDGAGYDVIVTSTHFAQAVNIEARGFLAEDNYFHLEPGIQQSVRLMQAPGSSIGRFSGTIGALNGFSRTNIAMMLD